MTPYTAVQLSDLVQMKNDARRLILLLWLWFLHALDVGHGEFQPVQSQAGAELCLGLAEPL